MEKSLRQLPSVDEVLRNAGITAMLENHPRMVILEAIRAVLASARKEVLAGAAGEFQGINKKECLELVVEKTTAMVRCSVQTNLRRVINATGIILHTNLGRALLCEGAKEADRKSVV